MTRKVGLSRALNADHTLHRFHCQYVEHSVKISAVFDAAEYPLYRFDQEAVAAEECYRFRVAEGLVVLHKPPFCWP